MNPEEFKAYIERMNKLSDSQAALLAKLAVNELSYRAIAHHLNTTPTNHTKTVVSHRVNRGAY